MEEECERNIYEKDGLMADHDNIEQTHCEKTTTSPFQVPHCSFVSINFPLNTGKLETTYSIRSPLPNMVINTISSYASSPSAILSLIICD